MCRPDGFGAHINSSANPETALEKAGFGRQFFKNPPALMAIISGFRDYQLRQTRLMPIGTADALTFRNQFSRTPENAGIGSCLIAENSEKRLVMGVCVLVGFS